MICMCNRIEARKILNLLRKYPHATIEDIRNKTGASGSCGKCAKRLEQFIDQHRPARGNELRLF